MSEPVLRLALPAPVWGLYDYLPPEGEAPVALQPGQRFMVPFGRGRRCAVLVELASESELPPERLKRALVRLDEKPLLPPDHLDFLLWAAHYYHHPPGEALFAALPARLRKGEPPLRPRPQWAVRTSRPAADLKRAPRQQALLAWLEAQGGTAALTALRQAMPGAPAALRALVEKELVALEIERPSPAAARPPAFEPDADQAAAVAAVTARPGGFRAWLLEGVTGSGKTEVYLQLAARVLAEGRNVLVLVPEIALTPQLVRRFAERLAVPMAVLHSGRGVGERELDWRRAAAGEARLVIGTRSAVLVPLPRLGLVVVDEEHDPSYKEQEGMRYSARDLAVVRARRAGCPVVLGSATPSLESLQNAARKRYGHLRLRRRAGGARPPAMALLDVRNRPLEGGLSPPLLARIGRVLEKGHQVMVFLNRRGWAPVVHCRSCGWLSECPNCDARQTWHRSLGSLVCHHCGSRRPLPPACPDCGGPLQPLGAGTERLEEVLTRRFPGHPLVRIDRDSTAARGSLEKLLAEVRQGRPGLLVGTQMLAKGHHFPQVALVALVDVDGGLFSADFRAAERMAQLIVQVAGRAGRGAVPGEVLLQTRYPDHPLLQTLVREGYDAFAQAALAERRAAELPPFSHQALVRAAARKSEAAERFLAQAAALASQTGGDRVGVWGPVPAPMARRAGLHRHQLLLQSTARGDLQELLDTLVPALCRLPDSGRVRWSVDVDPVELY